MRCPACNAPVADDAALESHIESTENCLRAVEMGLVEEF